MEKLAAPRNSTRSSSRSRNAAINASLSAVNIPDGAFEDLADDNESDEAGSQDGEYSPIRAQSNPDDSDRSGKPRRGRSAQNSRSSERLTRLARVQVEDETKKPVSTRPKRACTSDINYSALLHNSNYDENAGRATDPDLPKPERRSKYTPKQLIPEVPSPRTRKTRKTAIINNDHEAELRPFLQHDETPRRMSTREDVGQEPVSTTKSNNKTSRKRKHSEVEASESNPATATTVDPAQENDEGEGERTVKRRQAKPKAHLGFLPNRQPRKRRKRRTREQMLLDEAKSDALIPRRRSKYQFPYLDGYIGPPPPDDATIIARQEEQERQNPTCASTYDPETSSYLESLDEEDDGPLETQTQKPDIGSAAARAILSTHPNTNAQLAINLTENRNTTTAAAQAAFYKASNLLQIPEMIFFAEDLAKGRENAVKLRTSLDEEDRSNQKSATSSETLAAQLSASLAKEVQITKKLEAQLNSIGAERSNLEKKLQDTRGDRDNLRKEYDSLKVEKSNLEERLHGAEAERDAAKADNDSIVADRDNYMKESNNLTVEMETLKASRNTSPIAPLTAPKTLASIKPRLSTLRSAHIRLAGHLRTTTERHNKLKASIDQFNTALEDDEMTMRGVRNAVKDLVQESDKADGCLKGARDASEGLKEEVIGLMDRSEG
ncbi:MAG: hypothetical protein Q9179_007929 [Wetmoreana sp. 5 TL-2023]